MRPGTRGEVLTAADHLSAYVLEWTLHHLDLTAHVPDAPPPPPKTLAEARALLGGVTGEPFPAALSDTDTLLVATGRRLPDPPGSGPHSAP
ncbi:hypothetical protein GCM10017776_46950 [Streptomyces griseoluteus]|nr:hypothetical protein GCM10017776_46950 [Streptomyces griseoluteus]